MRGTSCQSNAAETGFAFSRFKNVWYYNSATECTLSKVNAVSLCILAKDFDPEKYKALCQLLTTVYAKSGDTVRPGQVKTGLLCNLDTCWVCAGSSAEGLSRGVHHRRLRWGSPRQVQPARPRLKTSAARDADQGIGHAVRCRGDPDLDSAFAQEACAR